MVELSHPSLGEPYRSTSWHRVLWLPRAWLIEPIIKVVLIPVGMTSELLWAHTTGYRRLLCPAGTERAGHIIGNHINNWQHAAMYPAFLVSGITDIAAHYFDLPPGIDKVVLGHAYLVEAMLMGLHKKHTPLDTSVHELLFYAMLATCVAVFLEAKYPAAFGPSFLRAAAQLTQGVWFFAAAYIGWGGNPAWKETIHTPGDDSAPAIAATVVFLKVIILLMCCMSAIWLIMYRLYRPDLARAERDALAVQGVKGGGTELSTRRRGMCDENEHSVIGVVASGVTLMAVAALVPMLIRATRGG
mmetsp:Transcript_18651/g.47280  ORF Transcript_18651/g.47280 Transcript_18651/m.47280 type:complete len:301 (-) Transcript_18651:366-1268(-)|eukprot:CAMPEP_0202878492 /NCGR_PEP_ID=MMETSP1391-20130828/32262_1 /ASSEMBLY_ACC=CAM_ASM_000867 /TAXON_ID=1034604 /ORGANISM="Chlamydomonas leiostraca, Strain SAG 11-49" /LENGTH=300 /DNA_ID=CAMNT_0049560689 /DNA_START=62 /DNA_END=964 /DNA_ORIENTATION=-